MHTRNKPETQPNQTSLQLPLLDQPCRLPLPPAQVLLSLKPSCLELRLKFSNASTKTFGLQGTPGGTPLADPNESCWQAPNLDAYQEQTRDTAKPNISAAASAGSAFPASAASCTSRSSTQPSCLELRFKFGDASTKTFSLQGIPRWNSYTDGYQSCWRITRPDQKSQKLLKRHVCQKHKAGLFRVLFLSSESRMP